MGRRFRGGALGSALGIRGVPPINPLADYKDKATFDLFYGFVKERVGNLGANQYLQIRTIAEPLDIAVRYPWFSYCNYLTRIDTTIVPVPLSDQYVTEDTPFSEEFARFLRGEGTTINWSFSKTVRDSVHYFSTVLSETAPP